MNRSSEKVVAGSLGAVGLLAAVVGLGWHLLGPASAPTVQAPPAAPVIVRPVVKPVVPVVRPAPDCPGPNCPRRPLLPWRRSSALAVAGDPVPAVDLMALPPSVRPRNTGGRDGEGLCVFTSIQYAAWYQNEPRLRRFQAQMKAEPGGGHPQKVEAMVRKYGPGAGYVQHVGSGDTSLIELALKTGRAPCITWNQGAHMLNCVYLDGERAGIFDNNGPPRVQWFSRAEFMRQFVGRPPGRPQGYAWTFVLTAPPPPPPPASAPPRSWEWAEPDEVAPPPHGVVLPFVADGPPWSLDGRPCTAAQVAAALTDDSHLPHLTVIGSDAERAPIVAELAPLAEGRALLQGYAPDAWELASGHVTTSRVYLQDRAGRVLLRLDEYSRDLVAQALRQADPNYDPRADPDGKPQAAPASAGGGVRPILDKYGLPCGLGGLGALATLLVATWLRSRGAAAAGPGGQAPEAAQGPRAPRDRLDELAQRLLDRHLEKLFQDLPPSPAPTPAK